MSDLTDFGKATTHRTIRASQLEGAFDVAPEGYEWADLLSAGLGNGARVLMCVRCAALVLIPKAHDVWHEVVRDDES